MNCPFCKKDYLEITNTRATRGDSQVWRRRRCINCEEVFTTHEFIDLSHILVIKRSGKTERFNRMKLYSGIFYASQVAKIKNREIFIDKLTQEIETQVLGLKKKRVESSIIQDIVLKQLRKKSTATFLRFLIYCKDINSDIQMKKELSKYVI